MQQIYVVNIRIVVMVRIPTATVSLSADIDIFGI